MKICCFAGHSRIYDESDLYKRIYEKCEMLITNFKADEFWVGNYGVFDKMSARVLQDLKKKYSDIQINLVVPYITTEITRNKQRYYKVFDNIIISEMSKNIPPQYRIIKSNQYMIDNCDFLIAYVKYSWGGAAKTFEYAKKKENIKIFNLA